MGLNMRVCRERWEDIARNVILVGVLVVALAGVGGSAQNATSCYSCVNCSAMSTWQDTAMDKFFSNLGASMGYSMYMYNFDDFNALETRFGGSCPTGGPGTAEEMDLAIPDTPCITYYFTIKQNSDIGTETLSCTILGAAEKFFMEADANMTTSMLEYWINMWTGSMGSSMLQDLARVATENEYKSATGNVSACMDSDNCNFFPTGDTVKISDTIGAWDDDLNNKASELYKGAEKFVDDVCIKLRGGEADCSFEVEKTASSSAKRQRRNTFEAVVVISVPYPPGGAPSETEAADFYKKAAKEVADEDTGSDFFTQFSVGVNVEAKVEPGGKDPDEASSSPNGPTLAGLALAVPLLCSFSNQF